MKIYDVSMDLKTGMLIHPRDAGFELKQISFIPENSCNKSIVAMGTHSGTHVDAHKHMENNNQTIDKVSLDSLIGNCKVLDLTKVEKEISSKDLKKFKIVKNDRLLFKTKNSLKRSDVFNENFVKLSDEAAKYLTSKKIKCVGIDYLGIGSHECHKILFRNKVSIIEGLDLSKVKAGSYELICLPLKLIGAEASPARAVLIKK